MTMCHFKCAMHELRSAIFIDCRLVQVSEQVTSPNSEWGVSQDFAKLHEAHMPPRVERLVIGMNE